MNRRQIWIVTDGRAGNEAQATGLARALTEQAPADIVIKRLELKAWAARVPAWPSWLIARQSPSLMNALLSSDDLSPPWPDLIVGAGRRVAPVVASLRKHHAIRAIQLLSPQLPANLFDAVIAPTHDRLQGANVLATVGALSATGPDRITAHAETLPRHLHDLPTPRLGVLIGGPSRSAVFSDADGDRLLNTLARLSETRSLLVTPSRRTPAALVDRLRSLPSDRVYVWDGEDSNPYPGLLALADAVLVTADSVNMASEAAGTGKPVHIFPVTRIAPKLTRFHAALAAQGASRLLSEPMAEWSYAPLVEASRIARELVERKLW